MTTPETATAILNIDLDAVAANYRLLSGRLGSARCAAVVKGDAYGLGAARIVPTLAAAGCDTFFVATLDEGIALAAILRERGLAGDVHVLGGVAPGTAEHFAEHGLIPTLNSLQQIDDWRALRAERPGPLPADIHIDTGMSRLGLAADEVAAIAGNPGRLAGLTLRYVMSHLACADEVDHPMNRAQLERFRAARAVLPPAQAALANSAGIFLGPEYHFDLVRAGIALYGVNPLSSGANPMTQVVTLKGKILQVRDVDTPQTVGYGATRQFAGPARIATVGVGYADGYLRSLSNVGHGFAGNARLPIVGRVSMDLITVDVTAAPRDAVRPGAFVELIGPHVPVEDVAASAGTIGYEILTRLGNRVHRDYRGGA